MTALLRTDGLLCDVNPLEVEALEPAPAADLPVGIPAGTFVRLGSGAALIVQGTVAAVAAALAIPTGGAIVGTAFVFRPTAVDAPAVGVYGSWASLLVATAALVAAGAPFSILVDLSLLGAPFLVPAPTNFGGQCTLRGLPSFFSLDCTSVATLSGIVEIDGLTVNAPALGGPTGALLMPPGPSLLRLRGIAQLLSSNAAGPLITVAVGDTLTIEMHDTSSLALGANAAIECDGPGAALAVVIGDASVVQSGSIADGVAPGSALGLIKGTAQARLPATLALFVGYNAGGVTIAVATIVLGAPGAVVHGGQYGTAALPLIFGAYFLEWGGNSAVALATAVDSPLIEPQQSGGRPRLLAGAIISADVDGVDGVLASTVEVLVNGVLVPGMTANPATLMQLNTTPIQLTPTTPIILAPLDTVSVRFTYGAAGIVATPTNPRAQLLVA